MSPNEKLVFPFLIGSDDSIFFSFFLFIIERDGCLVKGGGGLGTISCFCLDDLAPLLPFETKGLLVVGATAAASAAAVGAPPVEGVAPVVDEELFVFVLRLLLTVVTSELSFWFSFCFLKKKKKII